MQEELSSENARQKSQTETSLFVPFSHLGGCSVNVPSQSVAVSSSDFYWPVIGLFFTKYA